MKIGLDLLYIIPGGNREDRCFGSGEVWYIQAATLRTSRRHAEEAERAEGTPSPLVAARAGG